MDKFNKDVRSFTMSKIKKTDTKPEIIVRKFLFSKGLRFRIHYKKLPGNPDIVFVKRKIVIFVNGCFWHAHEGCKLNRLPKSNESYWHPKIKKNAERDQSNQQALSSLGWHVMVIWECELNKDKQEQSLNDLYKEILKLDTAN